MKTKLPSKANNVTLGLKVAGICRHHLQTSGFSRHRQASNLITCTSNLGQSHLPNAQCTLYCATYLTYLTAPTYLNGDNNVPQCIHFVSLHTTIQNTPSICLVCFIPVVYLIIPRCSDDSSMPSALNISTLVVSNIGFDPTQLPFFDSTQPPQGVNGLKPVHSSGQLLLETLQAQP